MNLPFFGGFVTLKMEFNNGMIDLVSATCHVMGNSSPCDFFSIGYTCPVGLARSSADALQKLAEAGLSYEANMFHDAKPKGESSHGMNF